MVKFARVRALPRSAITTVGSPVTRTHEGAPALVRDPKSELFLLAVTNMVSERTFYETGRARDARFVQLVHSVTASDPGWVRRFVPWLRNVAQMRSAAVVVAAEYVAAGGEGGRQVVASALSRADDPAEMLAYWTVEHGRRIPQPIKRGVADAVRRLYTQYAALKYDGLSRPWRPADVIELVHPKPANAEQSDLFRYLLDRRHHPESLQVPESLPTVARRVELEAVPMDQRRALLRERGVELLAEAGATWEWLSGWVSPMDAEAWEAVIPSMGYMALLRNLRNFDEAAISDEAAAAVAARLADPAAVARSRQFPYRFWSAYRSVPSARWLSILETALGHAVGNVPALAGRTLVLTDTSASMLARRCLAVRPSATSRSQRCSLRPLRLARPMSTSCRSRPALSGFGSGGPNRCCGPWSWWSVGSVRWVTAPTSAPRSGGGSTATTVSSCFRTCRSTTNSRDSTV